MVWAKCYLQSSKTELSLLGASLSKKKERRKHQSRESVLNIHIKYIEFIQELLSKIEKINEKVEELRQSDWSEESVRVLEAVKKELQNINEKIKAEVAKTAA